MSAVNGGPQDDVDEPGRRAGSRLADLPDRAVLEGDELQRLEARVMA